jgi:iron complex outermembrane receptor protein
LFCSTSRLGAGALALAAGLAHAPAVFAADAASPSSSAVGEVVVTADKAGLLERKPSQTVFGLSKPLIETPRSASFVSALTIQRYGVQTVNDLVAVSPSSYTASFYGVPGALNIRGTLADNYFLGFKLIENRGTYSTPIGDAAQIDVVRGPPSPIYGPGKVGGLLNFTPKTARDSGAYLTHPVGEVDVTVGAYDKKNINAQAGAPVTLGAAEGGVYAYGEIDDSGSFYKGIHPRRQTGEASASFDLPDGWRVTGDALVYHSDGDVQTAGWNRLTQGLIDHRTYITGQNTSLAATPGVPYLTPAQASPGAFGAYPNNFTAAGAGLAAYYFGFPPSLPAAFTLNSPGAGQTVSLSPRDVYIGPQDFSKTFMPAVVLGLSKDLGDAGTIKLQLFYNGLENKRFVSYGFPAWLRGNTYEARLSYDVKADGLGGLVHTETIAGASYRDYQGRDMQSFNTGLIALDRRDLSVGETPTDSICDPFTLGITGDQHPANCQGWELDIHSREHDAGLFATTDIAIARRLDLILGGRYDWFDVTSTDTGIQSFDAPSASASKGDGTYTASLSYKLGWGLMPYATYAKAVALEVQQAGDLKPADIASGGWLSQSDLAEAGVKFQLLDKTLVGAVDAYRQHRTQLSGLNAVQQATLSTGVEVELRYVATKNLSFTLSGDSQHTEVIGPDKSTEYIPAHAVCGANLACELGSWGGAYLVFNFDTLPGRAGNYSDAAIPHTVVSLYANYTSDEHAWGRAGLTIGATHVSKTSGTIVGAVVYPAYYVANASVSWRRGGYEAILNIDNLFDALYFTPNADPTYVNMSALPSIGRVWRLTLKKSF